VRGLGAMLALEFVEDRDSRRPAPDFAQRVVESARDHGLLLLKSGAAKNVIRLLPPLTANPDDVKRGLEILGIAISEVTR